MPKLKVEKKELKNKSKEKVQKTTVKKVQAKKPQTKRTKNVKKTNSKTLTPAQKAVSLKELKKVVNKKVTLKEKVKKEKKPKNYLIEYYDLPYRYNETVVKILAQTPKRLFVYWDISDKDKQTYINAFGEDFFEKTYPVLLIHNEELNYTFEVPINDFANSWYLDIKDSKTKYVVQLGRKFRNVSEIKTNSEVIEKENINLKNDFIYITDSNKLEIPNDHILFEKITNQVTYRNVKDGTEINKDISKVLENLGKTYQNPKIKDIYEKLYGDEIDLSNPSSGDIPTSR